MKTAFAVALFTIVILSSCGTYRYYAPTANPALFQGAGEVNVAGDVGTSGASAKVSASITNHFAVMGQYAGNFARNSSKEYEIAAGYYMSKGTSCDFFSAGVNWGNNWGYADTTRTNLDYQGHYIRPFVQVNAGKTGAKLFWKVKGDIMVGLKVGYFMYKGQYLDGSGEKLRSNYTLTEPFFMWGIGSRVFHFDIIWGIPMHLTLDPLSSSGNARTFPMNLSFGIRFLIGRPKTE